MVESKFKALNNELSSQNQAIEADLKLIDKSLNIPLKKVPIGIAE